MTVCAVTRACQAPAGSLCCLLPTLMTVYRPDSGLHLTTAHTKPGFWSWQAERKSHRPTSHQHSTLMDTASTKQLHFHTFFPLSFISTMSTLWVFVVLSVLSARQFSALHPLLKDNSRSPCKDTVTCWLQCNDVNDWLEWFNLSDWDANYLFCADL